jgi:hypothetical protein
MRIDEYKDYPISIALHSLRDKGFQLIDIINKNKYQMINEVEKITLLIHTYIPEDDNCECVNGIYLINEMITDFNLAFNEEYYFNQFKKEYPSKTIKFYQTEDTLFTFRL